jgi:hypothetical protein
VNVCPFNYIVPNIGLAIFFVVFEIFYYLLEYCLIFAGCVYYLGI